MFGYITINKPELKVKEYNRYKAFYCGLCKVLKEQHGRLGQITLTYDMTFIIILLSSLYESKTEYGEERCIVHPTKKHSILVSEITEYAADMNIAMTFHKLKDDWVDDHSKKGYAGTYLYRKKYKQIEKKYPRQCKVIEDTLTRLAQYEQSNDDRIDEVARCFGELMSELFVYQEDEWQKDLRELGFYLGKFIYIMDAYEDVVEDIKRKRYNPLISIYGKNDYEERCHEMLLSMMAECSKAFERLPLIVDIELLRNIIYAGVWLKYDKLQQEKCTKGEIRNNDSRSI